MKTKTALRRFRLFITDPDTVRNIEVFNFEYPRDKLEALDKIALAIKRGLGVEVRQIREEKCQT